MPLGLIVLGRAVPLGDASMPVLSPGAWTPRLSSCRIPITAFPAVGLDLDWAGRDPFRTGRNQAAPRRAKHTATMIVTIDGPAGAGKSSVARQLAERLGFRFLDTGAMYRAVALAALRQGLEGHDEAAIAQLARSLEITLDGTRVLLDGQEVSREIRTQAVTALTHWAANNAGVRRHLVELQRRAAGHDDVVTEGRDQGTVVFPDAEVKVFLTASPAERARRRLAELIGRGEPATYDEVFEQQRLRDDRDASRSVGPLCPATDAVEIVTDGLEPAEVVERIENLVRQRTNG